MMLAITTITTTVVAGAASCWTERGPLLSATRARATEAAPAGGAVAVLGAVASS